MKRSKDVNQINQRVSIRDLDASKTRKNNLAMISHDLRNALSGVTGGLAQIDIAGLDGDLRELLGQVRTSGNLLAKLLESALHEDLAENGVTSLYPSPTTLSALLGEMEELWRHRATGKGLKFAIDVDPGSPQNLQVDATAFHRLSGNILGNAI